MAMGTGAPISGVASGSPASVDFFISYTAVDVGWAEWIAWQLEAAGYTTRIQAWDFGAGSHLVHEMQQTIQVARRTVAVWSEAYASSASVQAQWQAAWAADPLGAVRKLLVFRIENCDPPGFLAQLVYDDLFGVDQATATARLAAAAHGRRAKPEVEPAFPGDSPRPVAPGNTGTQPVFPGRPGPAVGEFDLLARGLELSRFTGRTRLIGDIENVIETHDRGYLLVLGAAGVGKTALAAHLVRKWQAKEWECAHHFTRLGAAGQTSQRACLALAGQLLDRHPPLRERLPPPDTFDSDTAAGEWLAGVITATAETRRAAAGATRRPSPLILIVDGLDEAQRAPDSDVSMPLGLPAPRDLPDGVFVVATSQYGAPLLALDTPHVTLLHLGGDGGRRDEQQESRRQNLRDMRDYLEEVTTGRRPGDPLATALADHGVRAAFVDTLLTRSDGAWMYLRYVLEEIRAGADPARVGDLPTGLRNYYLDRIARWRRTDGEAWQRSRFPALVRLAAMRRPVTASELAALAHTDRDLLVTWLDQDLRPFLVAPEDVADPSGEPRYQILHQSLRDLFAAPARAGQHLDGGLGNTWRGAMRAAHLDIARHLTPPGAPGERDWSGVDEYTRVTLAEHAAAGGCLDELVCDPGFLLRCEPTSILRRRADLLTPQGRAAANAYEEALSRWSRCAPDERAWWLHVWARKTGAATLAAASERTTPQDPTILTAIWAGTTQRTLQGHRKAVNTLAVVPLDGHSVLVSGGSDGTTRLWNPTTGEPDREPLVGHDGPVRAVAAVALDGQTVLATGSSDGTARLWDPATGKEIHTLAGHRGAVNGVAAVRSADGPVVLATVGDDATLRLWDPVTGRLLRTPLTGHDGRVRAVATVSMPDGTTLVASAGEDGTARLWDPRTGAQVWCLAEGEGERRPVTAVVAVSRRDGSALLATAGEDGVVRLWDPSTGHQVRSIAASDNRAARALAAVTLPGQQVGVAVAVGDATVRLWDTAEGEPVGGALTGSGKWVNAVAEVSTSDGRTLLAAGGSDGNIRLWDVSIALRAARPAAGHHGPVLAAAAVSAPGDATVVVATGGSDNTVRLWNAATGEPIMAPLTGHSGPVRAVAPVPLPNGQVLIATGGDDQTVRLWNVATGEPEGVPLPGHIGSVQAIAPLLLPDGRVWIATGGADRTVHLWDAVEARPARRALLGHTLSVRTLAAVRGSEPGTVRLLSGSGDGTLLLWDPVSGRRIGHPIISQAGRVRAVAAVPLPDGRLWIAAGGAYGTVRLWDPDTGKPVTRLSIGQNVQVNSLAAVVMAERTLLAVVSDDGLVRLWNPQSRQQENGPTPGHDGRVNTVGALTLPDGRAGFVTGGDDGAVLVWAFRTG